MRPSAEPAFSGINWSVLTLKVGQIHSGSLARFEL
jgi:hypothetical protein